MAAPPKKPDALAFTEGFFLALGRSWRLPEVSQKEDFFADFFRGLLKVDRVEPGRVSCSFPVDPALTNIYNTLHGGAVAAVAEMVALASMKTVAGDKDYFIGESNTSYLSAAAVNEVVEVDATILRQGRSVIVTTVDLRAKKTGKLLYTSRATFYIMPVSSL